MSFSERGFIHMKRIFIISIAIVTIMTILVVCIENMVQVCEVIYTSNIEKEYENIASENGEFDCLLIRSQAVTEGTEYYVEQSTNPALIELSKDIVLYNWINPSFLKLNNGFTMSGQVKYVVIIPQTNIIEKENKYNEEVARVKPERVIMLTQSTEISNYSNNGFFYVKDLSLMGHIRFYAGFFWPTLRESA